MTDVAGITITHPERIVYPELGLTKLDVANYYQRVAHLMLPHVRGRPLALVRCPEGSAGQCFFQKHWVGTLPKTLDTVMIKQSDGKRHPHVVVNNLAGLITLAQWGVMELHLWGAKADNPELPDRIVFDLDPGSGVSWTSTRDGARLLRTVLSELGLKSWIKSSGGKGLHVVVPILRRHEWDEVKQFAQGVANLLSREMPDRFVAKASKAVRPGKIYLDWLRNSRGASWVAPWSLRARADAGISAPFAWPQLSRITSPIDWALPLERRLPVRDPWANLLTTKQRLTRPMFQRVSTA